MRLLWLMACTVRLLVSLDRGLIGRIELEKVRVLAEALV